MKRIIFATAALILVLAMLGVGTLAYFTSTKTSYSNSFTTGTLTLQLADADEPYSGDVSATWTSPAGWAPGDQFESTIWLKNVGNVAAIAAYLNWNNLQDTSGLSHKIQVIGIYDSYPWCGEPGASCTAFGDNYIANYISLDLNGDGKISLYELQAFGDYRTTGVQPWDSKVTSSSVPGVPPVLPAGGELGIRFVFKLMDDTGNEFQGQTCTIDLTVMAAQHLLW